MNVLVIVIIVVIIRIKIKKDKFRENGFDEDGVVCFVFFFNFFM